MKTLILLLALFIFAHTASAYEVHIRKETEVCKFDKTGRPHCYYKKPTTLHYKQKMGRKSIRHSRIHRKHALKHQHRRGKKR